MGANHSEHVTHVANGTSSELRVFHHGTKVALSDLVEEVKGDGAGKSVPMHFQKDPHVAYLCISPKSHVQFENEGELFASVFVQDKDNPGVSAQTICMNEPVPRGRSFIVTSDYKIVLHKEGALSMWMDEHGIDHFK